MPVYYNDHDEHACQWLRELIAAGELPDGVVDSRCLTKLKGAELLGYSQIHLFAGIGGWALALRYAGVSPDELLITGSCPCQPFSAAGKRKGVEDERHLWPEMWRIINELNSARRMAGLRRIPTIFGEQVTGTDGDDWYVGVRADLEAVAYKVAAAHLPACSSPAESVEVCEAWCDEDRWEEYERQVDQWWKSEGETPYPDPPETDCVEDQRTLGTPHIRLRLCWVAVSEDIGASSDFRTWGSESDSVRSGNDGWLPNTDQSQFQRITSAGEQSIYECRHGDVCGSDGVADCSSSECGRRAQPSGDTGELFYAADSRSSCGLRDSSDCRFPGSSSGASEQRSQPGSGAAGELPLRPEGSGSVISGVQHSKSDGRVQRRAESERGSVACGCGNRGLCDTLQPGRSPIGEEQSGVSSGSTHHDPRGEAIQTPGWVLVTCGDGKTRRLKPGLEPLVDGVSGRLADGRTREDASRVAILKGIGNAIDPRMMAEFIRAAREANR